jgi:light-harvesting complex I chlorophyll a/b binding protein 3
VLCSYLDGSLPADYGFDPLGLLDPEGPGGFINPAWLEYSEVIHCRWAMLGAAGILTPEVLATYGLIPQTPAEVLWFKSGLVPPLGVYEKVRPPPACA